MSSCAFALVDVFTERPLAGNQLAVILNAEGLDAGQMPAIAREFNYSETTFVLPPRHAKADRRLRSFTKKEEVFGSGHHTLGAWWALAALGELDLRDPETKFWQEIGESVSPVAITSEGGAPLRVATAQNKPHFGDKPADLAGLARALGLDVSDFDLDRLAPQAVSTGARHLLTPARSLSVLERVRVDAEKLIAVTRPLGCDGCYLFSLETRDPDSAAHARAFSPGVGIAEDPATGSAAGPLAALLASRGLFPEGTWKVIEQGDEIGRPSRIEARVTGDQIEIAGRAVIVGEGELFL
ncbi:MAG TPA: PhzF family phenazine biosynthesis protein [Blastocatellia bacterium]